MSPECIIIVATLVCIMVMTARHLKSHPACMLTFEIRGYHPAIKEILEERELLIAHVSEHRAIIQVDPGHADILKDDCHRKNLVCKQLNKKD